MSSSSEKSKRFDVLGLGAVAVDDLLYVEGYPAPDEKIRVLRRERQAGGQTGTALVAAARVGAKCAYAGRLPQDELGRYVTKTFRREGIDCSSAPATMSAQVAHSTIIVDVTTGSRTILSSVSDEGLGPPPEGPSNSLIQDAKVLLIDHHGVEGTLRAAKLARSHGIPIVADFERIIKEPDFETLLNEYVDHLIVDRPFAEAVGESLNIKDLFASLWSAERKVVCVTSGSKGYCYQEVARDGAPGPIIRRPAFSVDAIDTTGCGDVFHGVYAALLGEGRPLEERLTKASAAAAINATQRGGQAGIPALATIDRFLRQSEAHPDN